MALDISAFRSIAAQNPDRLVNVSGQKLKSAKTQATCGPEAFKAAVDAFVKAYGDHYGAKLGNMSRQSLQEYADGSKPLTASVVKQMLDYADGKVGSAHLVPLLFGDFGVAADATNPLINDAFHNRIMENPAVRENPLLVSPVHMGLMMSGATFDEVFSAINCY